MSIETELLALKNAGGLIVAEDVVAWAKDNPASALHSSLEWDDAKAGHQYRLWQVRKLIAVYVTTEEGVRNLVSLSIDRTREGGGYRPLDDVLSSKALHEIMLQDALKELDRVQAKYEQLKELKPVWRARDEVRRKSRKGKEAASEAMRA